MSENNLKHFLQFIKIKYSELCFSDKQSKTSYIYSSMIDEKQYFQKSGICFDHSKTINSQIKKQKAPRLSEQCLTVNIYAD